MDPTPDGVPAFELPDVESEIVYVLDDDPAMRSGLRKLLTLSGYDVREFGAPRECLDSIDPGSPKLVITDHEMPEMTGTRFASEALAINPDLRVVLLTGAGGEDVAQAALRAGAFDYLRKPFEPSELLRTTSAAFVDHARLEYQRDMDVWLRAEVKRGTELLRRVTLGTITSLMNAAEASTPQFRGHSLRVAECATGIAEALGLEPADVGPIRTAALLHDVGMVAVPDAVLNKPGTLSRNEFALVAEHCRFGAELLKPLEHIGPVATYVLEHHERLDGSGYPDGKKGDEISLGGQIVGLAEAWSALTEDRPFRERMSPQDAVATLVGGAGAWFRADLIDALRQWRASARAGIPKDLTILAIHEEEPALDALAATLEGAGFVVERARSGLEAVGVYTSSDLDVVLADFAATTGDGIGLIRWLTRLNARVPVVAIGRGEGSDWEEKAREVGVETALERPFSDAELVAAIESAYRSQEVP